MKAHVLGFLEETEGYRDEETGDWVSGKTKETESYCKCDLVPNGRANTITIPDGSVQTYSYTVRNLPRDCREFRYGDKITLCLYKLHKFTCVLKLLFRRYIRIYVASQCKDIFNAVFLKIL